MNHAEAIQVRDELLDAWRGLSWEQLKARIGDAEHHSVRGPSGTEYQVEIEPLWDAGPEGDVRVMASVDDLSFLRVCCPLCTDFIMTPQGEVLG